MKDTNQRNVALLVAATFFMEILDGTILATAAPRIGKAFGVPSVAVGVAITAYLLTIAVLIPVSGWVVQRFGARRVFLAAIALFTVASLLCALSTSLIELTAWRVLQGVGGAMMVPVGRLVVLRSAEKSEIVRAVALLTWPALAAPVIAPLVGGLITTYATWQWIFVINLPFGIAAFIAALVLVPKVRDTRPPRFDGLGFVLSATGIGLLVYVGELLSERGPSGILEAAVGLVAIVLLGLAGIHFSRAAHPLLDLRAMRVETFRVSNGGGLVFRATINAMPFLLPLLFQDAFGFSPVVAGGYVLLLFLGNIAIKPATTWLLARFGFRGVIAASSFGAVLSMLLSAVLSPQTLPVLIGAVLFFGGVARSVGFTAYNTIAFADIHAAAMTDANTLASTLQQLAAGLGVALGAIALRAGQSLTTVPVDAFRLAFLGLAVLTVASTIEALLLSRGAGESIRPVRVRP